ncbi:hypothetical protein [Paenibacillus bovis]|uniref:Family 2 glycosyl transferase n=1 Tax=Paenibacillus bovis TaxID=1616788 RepID=A0A172ZAK8_9BACL|nr:hypothetical protein [Paenibacillus bovis]ANF94648.1 hypothetical protein AR543_00435 [Paenibacillus bovis]
MRSRKKSHQRPNRPLIITVVAAVIVIAAFSFWLLRGSPAGAPAADNDPTGKGGSYTVPVVDKDGIKRTSTVVGEQLAVYDGSTWQPSFWAGINLGATTPGHYPGELNPTKEDYLRWFPEMKAMNIRVLRIYTILPPFFYEALKEYNETQKEPLYLMQGVWSPEEELIGEDSRGRDAYTPEITQSFTKEIQEAVGAIHGQITIDETPGHAHGQYTADVSPYLLGWVVGTEWFPYAVDVTDKAHPDQPPYKGKYFSADADATAFESWVASMLDVAAEADMKYGWQHPMSFTNWVTTDPLKHPNEPLEQEDLVSVDPMNIKPVASSWQAGYFSSYHIYPYYPDLLRQQPEYKKYKKADGTVNPYAGYLHDMRKHHKGIPLVVAEFGMPSSRGMAHYGPLGRNQGMHTEEEQGKLDAGLVKDIYDEGLDGALLFEWQDEWFKFTWNTIDLEPADRRAMWRNRLTNEEHFGVIAVEPEASVDDMIHLDGKTEDWAKNQTAITQDYPDMTMQMTHDAANLYVKLEKKNGNWDFSQNNLYIGFDTNGEGSLKSDKAPGVTFNQPIEFLVSIQGNTEKDSHIYINSGYDQHTYLYGASRKEIPYDPKYADGAAGYFLPWKLALNRELYLPQTKVTMPFEELEVGKLHHGINDPNSPEFNNLSDWYAKDNVIEFAIPWMLLGFIDPSSLTVWENPYQAKGVAPQKTDGVKASPVLVPKNSQAAVNAPAFGSYTWEPWNEPVSHERPKKSYAILQEAYAQYAKPAKKEQ